MPRTMRCISRRSSKAFRCLFPRAMMAHRLVAGEYYWATTGIGVSGFASTPYNVAVGGTDFGDTYAGTNSTYWSSTNSSTYGSALSYVPEIPWNDSCGSQLLAEFYGYSVTYGIRWFLLQRDGA